MNSRVRRLLGTYGKHRFRKHNDEDEVPEIEVSSTSSASGSHLDDDSVSQVYVGGDPYADVRERMEELAAANKDAYAAGHRTEAVIPFIVAYVVYMNYASLIFVGHMRDFCAWLFGRGRFVRRSTGFPSDDNTLYAPLLKSWEHFFTRRLYSRIQDVFNRPIASNPGAHIHMLERVSSDSKKSCDVLESLDDLDTERQRELYLNSPHYAPTAEGRPGRLCLNLGSYNYLGFADDWSTTCAKDVKGALVHLPVSTCSSQKEYGSTIIHRELERTVAEFVGKEHAIVLNMGFNTNATTIPALVGRGDVVISDELNHTSIVNGARASGAAIRIFRHNDMQDLEETLKETIIMGRPRTRRPWRKILVVVEGVYSMEGEYCDLKNVVRLCKEYGAYVYLDEAHSIGAMGATGRGCAEFTGVDPADIDIMMGTFTKSFGGMGGYIASSKEVIDHLRQKCAGILVHSSLSPAVCQQVLTAFKVIMGQDGTNIGKLKLQALRDNANYFRMRLEELGLQVLGHYDSPIMPVMLYAPGKISGFSRESLKRGLAVVVVGFPAVPILLSRARFCLSAGHTRADLDRALQELDDIADLCNLRYARSMFG